MSTDGRQIDASKGMDESGMGMAEMPGMPPMGIAVTGASDKVFLDADGNPKVKQIAEFVRYSGWPELKEAMIAGKLRASMMLAPMAMDLADRGVPVKIVALGHRSGAVIMVRKESPFKTFADLKGKRIAIPSRFAVDHIFVRRLMRENGLVNGDLTMVEMPPPDMPAALLANAVDAYATGEPFGAKSEMAGYARVLYMTRDVWPTYICCVLTVREDLIKEDPAMVQTLVNYVMSAGRWLDSDTTHRTMAAHIASEPGFFNQAFELIEWVMQRPTDRVTYGDLSLIKSEFDSLMVLSQDAGILTHPVPYEKYVDETFMRNFTPVDLKLTAGTP
jgi:NitT/TauT family transport system substrate-binding protein